MLCVTCLATDNTESKFFNTIKKKSQFPFKLIFCVSFQRGSNYLWPLFHDGPLDKEFFFH